MYGDFDAKQRQALANAVKQARLNRRWGKEEAARVADISSITWKKVEDGLVVQPTKLRAMEQALGWASGSIDTAANGGVVAEEESRPLPPADGDDPVIAEGFRAVTKFAQDCVDRGARLSLVSGLVSRAAQLVDELGGAIPTDTPGIDIVYAEDAEVIEPEPSREP